MARTKGAKDRRPRRRPTTTKKTTKKVAKKKAATPKPQPRAGHGGPTDQPPAETPAAGPTSVAEFNQAIDAELGNAAGDQTSSPPTGDRSTPADSGPHSNQADPQSTLGDALLTRDAWQGVLRVPFRALALILSSIGLIEVRGAQAIKLVGEKRAPDLARPSYVIFDHYARKYAEMNPDDPLSLAWAATGLVAADIAEELAEVIVVSRRLAAQEKQKRPVSTGQDQTGQGSPR